MRNLKLNSIISVAISLIALTPLPVTAESIVRMATTTSTDNSGLLRELLPPFEKKFGYKVHVVAVGTGKALRMGRDGDADVILVHAYGDELRFVENGYGINRRDVMYNDFIVVGPKSDPAAIGNSKDVVLALTRIHETESLFLSRGDDSGTHKRERWLWKQANLTPEASWYREAGQGMGRVLQMSDELESYTLTDRGTWLAHKSNLPHLELTVEGDKRLYNRYGIIAINPERFKEVNYEGAMKLMDWVVSTAGQKIIENFKIGGQALFLPLANAD